MTTPKQHKIYEFIRHYIQENNYSPTLEEIAKGIGISPRSVSLISRSVHALAKAGKISLHEKGYRNIRLADANISLPLIGRIAAGSPIEAIPEHEKIDMGSLLKSTEHFLLQVTGDSMLEEGILDGDFVICKQANTAYEGDIIVALIDQHEATLKRISYRLKNQITLIPANAAHKPKAYLPSRIQIQGVFIGLLRLKR